MDDNLEQIKLEIEGLDKKLDSFSKTAVSKGWHGYMQWVNEKRVSLLNDLESIPHTLDNTYRREYILGQLNGLKEANVYRDYIVQSLKVKKTQLSALKQKRVYNV